MWRFLPLVLLLVTVLAARFAVLAVGIVSAGIGAVAQAVAYVAVGLCVILAAIPYAVAYAVHLLHLGWFATLPQALVFLIERWSFLVDWWRWLVGS
jgi:hypothetical protein